MNSFARAPPPAVSPNSWISDSSYITTSQYFITNAGDASFSGMPSQYFISNYEDRPLSILGYPKTSKATVSAMSSQYCISTSGTQLTSTWTIISSHYADESEKDGYISNSRTTVSAMPSKYYISSDSYSISDAMTSIPSSFYSSMSDSTLLSDTEAEDVQSVIKQLEEIDYDSRISDPSVSDGEDNPCPNGCGVQSKLDYLNVVNGDGGKSKAHRKLQAERVLIAPRIQKVEYVRATRGWSGICKFQPRERRGHAKLIRFYDTVDFKPPEYQKVLVLTDSNTSR
uniref:Uncharacterized protein n=1 Tax=Panagrellus redivivus TaxID=6233 RepID=A0A7E4ZS00_PANRE